MYRYRIRNQRRTARHGDWVPQRRQGSTITMPVDCEGSIADMGGDSFYSQTLDQLTCCGNSFLKSVERQYLFGSS